MGKRKTKKIKPKAKPRTSKISSQFDCPFCNTEKGISIKINKDAKFAELSCQSCEAKYATTCTSLDAPIDIYVDWLDRCREASDPNAPQEFPTLTSAMRGEESDDED
ncbi:putative Transcription elongation factor Elf1 like [Blattamonas nauphoetae]|uniref:Transcription elongation factor 1 homolog n=1 Tax=Blattamonas nauphoetae TaxID=2049346 RepID=A0ABQ9XG44_9EUKA|nr:putative Transcription elongation factor Elf1 like [Blattamonas nauphoetae]